MNSNKMKFKYTKIHSTNLQILNKFKYQKVDNRKIKTVFYEYFSFSWSVFFLPIFSADKFIIKNNWNKWYNLLIYNTMICYEDEGEHRLSLRLSSLTAKSSKFLSLSSKFTKTLIVFKFSVSEFVTFHF